MRQHDQGHVVMPPVPTSAFVDPKTGLTTDGQLGDWLGPQNNALGSAFLATAYHAYDLAIMAQAAKLLARMPPPPSIGNSTNSARLSSTEPS